MDPIKVIHVRLPISVVKAVDHYAVDHGLFRASATEAVLRAGLAALGRPVDGPEARHG